MGKRGPKKKIKTYCSTVEDINREKEQKRLEKNQKVKAGMLRYRAQERELYSACMSTQEMRDLHAKEMLMLQILSLLNDENGTDRLDKSE